MAFNLRKSGSSDNRRDQDSAAKAGASSEMYSITNAKPKKQDDQEDWLLTYSDMVTLMLVFFILLFSFSEIDQRQFEQIHESLQGSLLQQETSSPFTEVEQRIEETIVEYELEDIIETEDSSVGVRLQLGSTFLYESGSSQIRDEVKPPLEVIAGQISELDKVNYVVEVEGHTDDVPIATQVYQSNWELSAHRATNIVRFLNDQGIDEQRLEAKAYGESRPLVPNRDEYGEPIAENQAKNRRIVIHVRRASPAELTNFAADS